MGTRFCQGHHCGYGKWCSAVWRQSIYAFPASAGRGARTLSCRSLKIFAGLRKNGWLARKAIWRWQKVINQKKPFGKIFVSMPAGGRKGFKGAFAVYDNTIPLYAWSWRIIVIWLYFGFYKVMTIVYTFLKQSFLFFAMLKSAKIKVGNYKYRKQTDTRSLSI